MSDSRHSTRQRLIDAALELFAAQGITETTTKQIAESAEVNEVTLFRHFGNKHGLLLAVIKEAAIFMDLGQTWVQQAEQTHSIDQALREYAIAALQVLDKVPEVVRSVIGEAGQYPPENRRALGQGLTQANGYVAKYFAAVIDRGQIRGGQIRGGQIRGEQMPLSAEKLASLLNSLLLGYAVIESTSEFHDLWRDRDDFLEHLVRLFLPGDILAVPSTVPLTQPVADLPATLVHTLLQRAKKSGLQDYAMVYLLFAAGLSPEDLVRLELSHHISDAHHQLLQITSSISSRQVPINQWILGRRYGSHLRNPLTQWLKSRKDNQAALFLNTAGTPLLESEFRQRWQEITVEQFAPTGYPPTPEQAQQTWCIEMLTRGMEPDNLLLLTGWDADKLQPYIQRAKEKTAVEQAIQLDHKS